MARADAGHVVSAGLPPTGATPAIRRMAAEARRDAAAPLMSDSTEIAAHDLLRALAADVAAGAPEIAITITPDGIEVRRAEDAP